MKVLVLGSGGREDAMAWALEWGTRSRDDKVFVAPGNAGSTNRLNVDHVNPAEVTQLCISKSIDLVLVGPETSLKAGVTDALRSSGISVFGPSQAASQLETSKLFCREFAARHGIPSPRYAYFTGIEAGASAISWANSQDCDVVVKIDGLAGGKGVVVPNNMTERDIAIKKTAATGNFLLEERLFGDEVSILVFTDGITVKPMPPACDHKRIFEGDSGPNTGGMGVYAPTHLCSPQMVERIVHDIIEPAVQGLAAQGTPYVGVLYAGIMLTKDGPQLIEFNCRFGDPEAQTLLPLLKTDFKEIVLACINGTLDQLEIEWSTDSSCTVVLASGNYPDESIHGHVISGSEEAIAHESVNVFHSATLRDGSELRTNGGRVLCVQALGQDLAHARSRAYRAIDAIDFEGMQYRRDIGWREFARTTGGYAASGVNIDEGNRAVELMKSKVEQTHTRDVLSGVGAFGGALSIRSLKDMDEPVLVASTDGVGTKVIVASELGQYGNIGRDIVNHCVNDVLVQRAYPLFFLDYVASASLSAEMVATVVSGMADACLENSCVLLGGETAEMPTVYAEGHFDIAGTLVGVADRARLLPTGTIESGDVLLGIASSGLHTNGYSLARKILSGLPLDVCVNGMNRSLGEALLEPHRSYLNVLHNVLKTDLVKGLIHITGGGFQENIPRILPAGCGAQVALGSWPMPPLFEFLRSASGLDDDELHRTFNMGIGMIIVARAEDVESIRELIEEPLWEIGKITRDAKRVVLT